ncbi:hypothetical protein [Rhodoferax lacus]|uniref:hypothetical protein n=1 Tax=Rhodoferax lacus TaxID=2184758 RepID=UPI0011C15A78|nr:hypothetical protein [Rhodoferax lacus]
MADKLSSVIRHVGLSSLAVAVLMTLVAVFLACLLPVEVQARSPHIAKPNPAHAVIRPHEETMSEAHERNW